VGDLERRLKSDDCGGVGGGSSPSSLDMFLRSHEEYAMERWDTLSQNHRDILDNCLEGTNSGMRDMLRYSGIAGTDYKSFSMTSSDLDAIDEQVNPSIKCLHAHYAHYRSQVSERGYKQTDKSINVVGRWTHLILREEFPDLIL